MNKESGKRYSRQRECILNVLSKVKTHPNANWIYNEVKNEIPNISLGTVYRNLAQLGREGAILCIDAGDGTERYDFCAKPHYHLYCKKCGCVSDIDVEYESGLDKSAEKSNGAEIEYHSLVFYGVCSNCKK